MINILLVDDHELVRTGIASLLNDEASIQVVGTASSGEEAIKLVEYLNPDVVLMDVNMPGIGGIEACSRLHEINAQINVLMLTVHVDGNIPNQAFCKGAKGYISKNCNHEEFLEAIHRVARGEHYLGKDVAQSMNENGKVEQISPFESLSFREMQVVLLILQGEDILSIASILDVGIKTINTYRYRAFEKLSVKNDVELVACAARYEIKP